MPQFEGTFRFRREFAHRQIPQDAGPANQFHGGHGFTGLNYAYDLVFGAELQQLV